METFNQYKLFEAIENLSNEELEAKMQEVSTDEDKLGISVKQNAWAAQKYAAKSSKKKDIIDAMHEMQYQYHIKKSGDWTELDFNVWVNKYGIPSVKSKMFKALEFENKDFIEKVILPYCIKHAGRAYKDSVTSSSGYGYSCYEVSYAKSAFYIEDFLRENSMEAKTAKQKNNLLYEELDAKLLDFHKNYVNEIVEASSERFDSLKKDYSDFDFEKYTSQRTSYYDKRQIIGDFYKITKKEEEYLNANPYHSNSIEEYDILKKKYGWDLSNLSEKYKKQSPINKKMKIIENLVLEYDSFKNKNTYLEKVRIYAENEYKRCLNLVIDRINSTNMNTSLIEVESISKQDEKAFDIYITDGKKRFHARSILAAEFSELVTPHWRFIITSKK